MKIIAMLIWVGSYQGGPAMLSGFESIESCQQAIPQVQKTYSDMAQYLGQHTLTANVCIELTK